MMPFDNYPELAILCTSWAGKLDGCLEILKIFSFRNLIERIQDNGKSLNGRKKVEAW